MGGKSNNTQSTSSVSIPPEVLAQYNAVNQQAETVAQTPFQQYSNGPNAFVAPLTATQQAGILGTNQYSNEAQPFYQAASDMTQQAGGYTQQGMNTLTGAMGLTGQALNPNWANAAGGLTLENAGPVAQLNQGSINEYMSPYLRDVVGPTAQLMEQQFGQAQSGQMGNAIQNGAFGGDRERVAAANLQQQQGLAFGNTIGGLLNQGYGTAVSTAENQQQNQQANLSRGLGAANQFYGIGAGQQGLNLQQAGQLGQQAGEYGQLAGEYGGLGNQMGQIGAGAQAAGLSGAQAQLTAGQAQQQTEQAGLSALYNQFLQQQSYPFQTTQFLANIAEGTGALSGSTTNSNTSQPASFFSDERLKEDIKEIGKTHDGQPIIKFRYKDDPRHAHRIGLSAQDTEKRHPEAVGLAGGYRTVDYDAATRAAERPHRASGGLAPHYSEGGEVVPFQGRRGRDIGGPVAGLSPNSAWAGGFYIDPSYLNEMEQSYASAPWAGAGAQVTGSPYGGRSHVPPSSGGVHASLAVAKPPNVPQQQSGLQQASQSLGQLEKLAESGKKAYDWGKGAFGGNTQSSTSQSGGLAPQPSMNAQTPQDASGGDATAMLNDTSSLGGGIDYADLGPDLGAEDMMTDLFAARGGRIGLDGGGGAVVPTYGQPTDASSDDDSEGGAMPYISGTGSKGLMIPDDRSNNKLAVAQPPSSSSSGSDGGFNPMGLITGLAGLFLANGGRVGLAGGGTPPIDISDLALPTLTGTDDPSWGGPTVNATGLKPRDASMASATPPRPDTKFAPPNHDMPAPGGVVVDAGRDVTVHPRKGLAPPVADPRDAPMPPQADQYRAQAAPPAKGGLAPADYTSAMTPSPMVQPHERVPSEAPGLSVSEKQGRGFMGENQDSMVPLMKGFGKGLLTMLSSPSRYGLVALGQGIGAGLDEYGSAYEDTQNDMARRGQEGAHTVDTLSGANERQALTGQTQAATTGTMLQNEALRQAAQHGDYFSAGGNDYVTVDDGRGRPRNMLVGQWIAAGMPPTYHQAHTAAGTAPQPGAPPTNPVLGGQPISPQVLAQKYPNLGQAGAQIADQEMRPMLVGQNDWRQAQRHMSDDMEQRMANASAASIQSKQLLDQQAQNIAQMAPSGVGTPGALHNLGIAAAYRWNALVDTLGGSPDLKIAPDQVAASMNQQKLAAMAEFARGTQAGQHALGALQLAEHATPNTAMTKEALAKVLASLYVDNQQDIDKYNYLQDYRKYVMDKSGGALPLYTAQGAMRGFSNDHKLDRYGPDEQALEQILGGTANGTPILTRLQRGQLGPKQIQMLEKQLGAPGVFRYLRGGNG